MSSVMISLTPKSNPLLKRMVASSTPKKKYQFVHAASSHSTHLSLALQEAFAKRNFVDVTIICGLHTFYAHR
jgi:hypothetical protein